MLSPAFFSRSYMLSGLLEVFERLNDCTALIDPLQRWRKWLCMYCSTYGCNPCSFEQQNWGSGIQHWELSCIFRGLFSSGKFYWVTGLEMRSPCHLPSKWLHMWKRSLDRSYVYVPFGSGNVRHGWVRNLLSIDKLDNFSPMFAIP